MARHTQAEFVGFRLPRDLVERVDKLAAKMAAEQPGIPFNRSMVIRVLLNEALAAREATDGKA